MMIWWLTQLTLAAPASDDLVHMVVDELYGKDIPEEAVCIERPNLPAPFAEDLVVVGVMRGAVGCELLGVMVNGSYKPADVAASAAIAPKSWKGARQSERAQWLLQWTNTIHLAFKQFDIMGTSPTSVATGSGYDVTATYWERTDQDYVARNATGVFRYDRNGVLVGSEVTGPAYRYSFSAREYRLNGLNGDAIHQSLTQQGRTLKRCANDAWKKDLTLEGRTRMQFRLSQGKASQIALVAEDDSGTGIERCYSAALKKIDFPAEISGTVVWSFSLTRIPVEEQR